MRESTLLSPEQIDDLFTPFSDYGEQLPGQMRQEAIRLVQAMASEDQPVHWLSLLGASGTGKTMLARLIARVFSKWMDERLLDEHRSTPNSRFLRRGGLLSWSKCIDCMRNGDYGFMRQACDDWFLVLDDIGSEVGAENVRMREISAAKILSILNAREKKFTIITANLRADQIADKLDPRITSRLLRNGGVVVDSTGVIDFNLRPAARQRPAPAIHHGRPAREIV